MMENNTEEIFTEDMSEEQVIEAFMESKTDKPEEVVTETPLEEPIVDVPVEEEVAIETEPEPEAPIEESSLDVIDFSEPVLLKDRDLELPINNKDELLNLARQGLNFTRKTQDFAKHKPTLDYMEKHDISLEQLQTYAEAKSGNTDALGQIAKESNIDPLDVDANSQYKPNNDYAPKVANEVEAFAAEIQQDTQTANEFRGMMDYVPESFKSTLGSDVNTLKAFTQDVKSGVAKELMPEAVKLYALNGGDFVQSYIQAGNNVYGSQQETVAPTQQDVAPTQAQPVSENRAKAGISSASSSSSNSMEFDTWGSSDAEFMEKINSMAK